MQLGKIPDIWRSAEVIPVFKKGVASNVRNYRPISLTSVSCRLMESVIKIDVMSYYFVSKQLDL